LDWMTHRGPFQPLPFCGKKKKKVKPAGNGSTSN